MITALQVDGFKSLEGLDIPLGLVNVFVGANGSGKSNLLEALGVLSAAAGGRVDDQALLQRGVRTGVPRLYKSAFRPRKGGRGVPRHIHFVARSESASYEVTLHNPLEDPKPAWRFKHELWQEGGQKLASRSPASGVKYNTERGLAALKAVEVESGRPAMQLLEALQQFAVFAPATAALRGLTSDEPRVPLGVGGGRLPEAVRELLFSARQDEHARRVRGEALALIDWATNFGVAGSSSLPLSPAAATSQIVVRFDDRYMIPSRNVLSGYDASEGALYVLFLAVLAAHLWAPPLFAVDNVDHGLNPRLARGLLARFCDWCLTRTEPRQVLLTTHNPLSLDGLPLANDLVRLFTVERAADGRTVVNRVVWTSKFAEMAERGWTLSRLWVMGHLGGVPNV